MLSHTLIFLSQINGWQSLFLLFSQIPPLFTYCFLIIFKSKKRKTIKAEVCKFWKISTISKFIRWSSYTNLVMETFSHYSEFIWFCVRHHIVCLAWRPDSLRTEGLCAIFAQWLIQTTSFSTTQLHEISPLRTSFSTWPHVLAAVSSAKCFTIWI